MWASSSLAACGAGGVEDLDAALEATDLDRVTADAPRATDLDRVLVLTGGDDSEGSGPETRSETSEESVRMSLFGRAATPAGGAGAGKGTATTGAKGTRPTGKDAGASTKGKGADATATTATATKGADTSAKG